VKRKEILDRCFRPLSSGEAFRGRGTQESATPAKTG
jgi:hypothetical protein